MPNRDSTAAVIPVPGADSSVPSASPRIVTVVGLNDDNTVEVQIADAGESHSAKLAVPTTREYLELAVAGRRQAVVVFDNGDAGKPVIVGFVEPLPEAAPPSAAPVVEADVDGRRVRVTALDEIVLQCGNASITLRRNGRVIVRGTYVETHSEGTNRIKGGQILLN